MAVQSSLLLIILLALSSASGFQYVASPEEVVKIYD